MLQRRGRNDAETGVVELDVNIGQDELEINNKPKKNQKRKQRRRDRDDVKDTSGWWILKFSVLVTIVLVAGYFLVEHHEGMLVKRMRQNIIHNELEPLSKEWEEKYATLLEENEKLQQSAKLEDEMKTESDRLQKDHEQQQQAMKKLETKIGQLEKYKVKMKENIQLMSKTALVEKFGPGPHYVEIVVEFHPDFPKTNESDGDRGTIKILLADKDALPHVVYWFLEQVHRKLYDGCSFHRNAEHLVQGGPAPNFLSPPDPHLPKRFKEAGFYSVLFQEYSSQHPHKKYTLGYAGRPGGPDFYISTRDNSAIHGPGGQTSYEDPTEADPCFAKVVEGFEIVDRMHQSPVKPGGYKAMQNNVAIVSMTILDGDQEEGNGENQ